MTARLRKKQTSIEHQQESNRSLHDLGGNRTKKGEDSPTKGKEPCGPTKVAKQLPLLANEHGYCCFPNDGNPLRAPSASQEKGIQILNHQTVSASQKRPSKRIFTSVNSAPNHPPPAPVLQWPLSPSPAELPPGPHGVDWPWPQQLRSLTSSGVFRAISGWRAPTS